MRLPIYVNGFANTLVDSLIKKHLKKKWKSNLTSHSYLKEDQKRVSLNFFAPIQNDFNKYFTKFGLSVAWKSKNKFKNLRQQKM